MPILEHEAWTVSEALNKGLLDESQKQQGAKLLTEYADQQDAQGLRLWPERERQQDERRSSLFATMEDPRKLDDSNGIFAAADSIRPGAGDEMRKRAANEMFLADRYNLPVEQARKQYDALTIDYGAQKWNEATQLEPSRFFDRAREEVKAEKTRFDHINLTADAAMRAAMRGDSDVQSFANWQAANPDLPGATREVWRSVRGEVDKRLGADGRAAASRAFRALQNATGTGENADAWWNEARRDLVTLRQNQPEKYKLALQAIQAMAEGPAKEKGVAQGTGESFARGVEMLTSNAMSAVEPLQAVAARWGITNADDPQALAAHLEAGNQVDSDLRDLANGVIDPVKPTGWLDKALYTTAGSLPMMLGAMVPGGMQTMAASFTNEAYADLRSNGWTGGDAFAAAALSGVFQSAVEMASEGLIHIPGVAGVLSKYGVKPGTNWGAQFLLRSAGRGAVEFGEEVIQQAATPFVQELAHAIMPSIPGTPEGKHLGDVMTEFFKKENSVPLLLSVLPLGMIGAAATTRQDARIIDAVTSNDTLLRSVFSDADAAAIAAEKDPVKRKAMIREKWVSQPTEEIAKRAAKVLGEERIKAANAARAFAQAKRLGMIPTVRRDVQGWVVSTREGKPVRVETRQEAVELAYSHLSDLEYQSAAAMAQAADEFFIAGGAKGEAFEISKSGRRVQDEVDIGRVTPEQAAESIQVFGEMHGLTPEQAKAERLQVLGNNRAEEVEGVRTAVSRVFGGGNVITILHEGVHGRWRAGLESGHYTPQRGLAWVRMAEAASGQRFLATADDAAVSAEMLDEAITEVASADIIGRRKDGKTHFSAGLISRGVASFALAQRADAKEAGKLATFLKSWKEFWGRVLSNAKALKKARAEGKLGEDFDGFLDDLLGTEPQARHEAAAAKEAISLSALDEGTPFSLASLPPSASSKFFETPGRFYRVIVGDEAFRDIVSSGEVRTNAANKTREGMSLADRLAARPTAFPSFSKDAAAMSYAAQNPNHYIVISEDSSLQPSTEGRHSKGKTYFPTGKNGQHLKSLPSSSVAVYRHLENGNYDLVFLNGNVVTESNLAEIDNAPFSLAPNIETKEFKQWFRNSQVRDKDGNPLVVYHGSPDIRGLFSEGFRKFSRGNMFFASSDYKVANTYADPRRAFDYQNAEEGVIPLYLSIDTPLVINAKGERWRETEKRITEARDAGHDGVIINNVLDDYNTTTATRPTTVYVFFHPTQAKSALTEQMRSRLDGRPIAGAVPNSGAFDPNDPRLSFSLAPRITSTQDAEYMAAVEAGDMETAQRMVDAAAKAAGYGGMKILSDEEKRQWENKKNSLLGNASIADKNIKSAQAALDNPEVQGALRKVAGSSLERNSRNKKLYQDQIDAGPDPVRLFHGRSSKWTEYRRNITGRSIWATNDSNVAKTYGPDAASLYMSMHNPLEIDANGASFRQLEFEGNRLDADDLSTIAEERGHDGIIIRNFFDSNDDSGGYISSDHYSVFNPNQIKSADPVTRDESGNVIPLSQRFNEQSNDIRYSLAPRSLASVADTVLASKMKSPEFREQFMALAVSRIAELRRDGSWRVDKQGRASQREGADSIADRTRSASSITKEAQYRRRARQRELIEQGMNTLTNETRLAYEHGLESVEDQPLIVDMLGKHGKLMSWSTANAQGRIGRMDGDYDGAPTLPPKWYSKGSGIMPDVMAQNLYDDGHLKEPTTGALWEALAGVIDGVKAQNADVKKAIAAVKEVQKNADTQAKSETEAWAKEARAKVPTAKERQMLALRTLDAILSAFPAVIRGRVGGFVKLASLGSDKAREAEIAKRIDILDNVVESEAKKHYQARVDKLIERARPKTASGKKPTGKLGADVHATFATIEQAMGWTEERAEAHASGLEAEIAAGTMTPEQEALAQTEASIVRLVADWNPRSVATNKNNVAGKPIYQRVHGGADAARMASAYEAMTALYEGSTLARAEQVAAQRERRQAVRNSLISATGNLGTAAQRDERTMKDNGLGGFFREAGLGLLNFEQVLEWTFGANAEALALSDWERMASNQKEDAIEAKTTAIERLFTGLAGGRLKGEKLRWQMSQKTMSVQGRMLSELEAITATLMWRQADGQRHMEGHLDEAGQPVGTWHYNQAFVDEIEGRLSADAKEVREFIADQYGQEWQGLNEVYARMYGVNLPQHANYAPLTVMPQTAPSGMGIDPVTGSVVSGTSTTPGGLKSRSGKIAEPDFRDALQTYIAHTRQMEHWKAYAELAQEGRLALANREVGNAVESATNKQARQVLAGWIDYWAEGGARDAASYLAVVQGLGKAANRVAAAALVGRVGTLAVQATQLGAAAAEMPFSAYTLRLAKLMTGQLGWGAALRSAYIQRRISQMPPVVQQAMAGLKASKPNALKHAMQKVGWLISGADGLFTAGTFAIVYDYQIGQAQSLGLTGAEAVAYAEQAAERATDRIAQPTRAGARSLFENKSTNPFVKLSWAFASEGRKNLGLLLASGKAGMTGPRFWRAVLFVSVLNSGLAYMIRSAMRDARDPGDDEVFDEDHWSLKRLALGMGTDWLQGLPVAGQILQGGAYKLAGEYAPEGNLFSSVGRSVAGWGRILSGESKDGMKDIDLILSGLAPFNDTISAASSASHLARDVKDAAVNFFGE